MWREQSSELKASFRYAERSVDSVQVFVQHQVGFLQVQFVIGSVFLGTKLGEPRTRQRQLKGGSDDIRTV